jgi:serine phosphatase RsbU (regulator of sigma subunit)/anti-sigma regulatory factor (Ser/Thr protein kinase)
MTALLRSFLQTLTGQNQPAATETPQQPAAQPARPVKALTLEIAPNDPLAIYFQSSPGTVDIERLHMDSPALRALKAARVRLLVPLVSQGELIGVVSLDQRRSEQDYSSDDRGLLSNLATQAGPAVRVAQLVRQQQLEAQARERLEQELRVARLIQQTLLPKELPALAGWNVAAYYQPARSVGGDFYDFIYLPDGRLGLVIGDVTDKGVPAALVMATARALLRTAALQFDTPGQVLAQVNNLICPDIPPKMFVTCLYAILDSATGRLHYANAGHDLPYAWSGAGATELRARGMPLGLMSGMTYEEKEKMIAPGESILFYSDGLVEAHSPRRDMFGFPRLGQLVGGHGGGASIIEYLLDELKAFTGPDWEQEDDTTMVVVQRGEAEGGGEAASWQTIAAFTIPSEPGNEREAMRRVAEAVKDLNLPSARFEKLKTAVAEGTMNAIEHGNQNRPDLNVEIAVLVSAARDALAVRITDHALAGNKPAAAATPDLDAKLAGLQTPRGWGLFLIEKMVDKMNVIGDETHHTLELILALQGDGHAQ